MKGGASMKAIYNLKVNVAYKRRFSSVRYKNGEGILPVKLLTELQKFIQGELIYIPKKAKRAGWGELNGTRSNISNRNNEIYTFYKKGLSIKELGDKYHLSEDSIKKIIRSFRN